MRGMCRCWCNLGRDLSVMRAWIISMRQWHPADQISALLAGLALIGVFLVFKDYGLGWDDYTQWQYGHKLIDWYASGFKDQSAFNFANLYLYGGAFDMIGVLLERVLPLDPFEIRRLLGGLIALIGLGLVWWTARRMAGVWAGLAAVVLALLTPKLVGHAFINSKDLPFAVCVIGIVASLVAAIDSWPRPSWRTGILLGIALGFGLGTRVGVVVSGAYVIPALALLIIEDTRRINAATAWRNAGTFVLRLLPSLPIAYVLMRILWPWSGFSLMNPVHAFITFLDQTIDKPWEEIFEGQERLWSFMPWRYVPKMLSLTLPEIFLAAALAGMAVIIWRLVSGRAPIRWSAAASIIMLAFVLPIFLSMVLNPPRYGNVRHYLFAIMPMAILGGIFAAAAIDYLRQQPMAMRIVAASAVIFGLSLPLTEIIRLHPYEYSYFNQFAGGLKGANGRYMTEYWGTSFKEAGEELHDYLDEMGMQMPPGGFKVATCGPHNSARVALGEGFVHSYDPKNADFMLVLGQYYCATLLNTPIVTVEREGVTLARIWDVRGKHVVSVFADEYNVEPLE